MSKIHGYRDACDFNGDEFPADGQHLIGVRDSDLLRLRPRGILPGDPRLPQIEAAITRVTGKRSGSA